MEKLNKLTPEQEAKMHQVKQFWLDYLLSCKNRLDKTKATEGVNWLYNFCNLKPPTIIFVDSPMACQYAVHFIRKNNGKNLENIHSEIKRMMDAREKIEYELFCDYGSIRDFGWASFYDFFTQIGVLNNENFNKFKDLLLSGVYDMIQLEDYCVVSDMPTFIGMDDENRMHCTTGPAIKWADGYCQYYIRSRYIQKDIALLALNGELTRERYINETNDEHRAAWYAYLGEEKMMNLLGAVETDTFKVEHDKKISVVTPDGTIKWQLTNEVEVETITLFKTKDKLNKVKNKPYAWLKRVCPSTGTVYMTPTNPDFETAEESAKFHRPDWVPTSVGYRWYSRS